MEEIKETLKMSIIGALFISIISFGIFGTFFAMAKIRNHYADKPEKINCDCK